MALLVPPAAPDQFSVTFVLGRTLLLETVTEDGAVHAVTVVVSVAVADDCPLL